jgi:hypothetical protein
MRSVTSIQSKEIHATRFMLTVEICYCLHLKSDIDVINRHLVLGCAILYKRLQQDEQHA